MDEAKASLVTITRDKAKYTGILQQLLTQGGILVPSHCLCDAVLHRGKRHQRWNIPRALSVAWASASHPLSPSGPGFGWAGLTLFWSYLFLSLLSIVVVVKLTRGIGYALMQVPSLLWSYLFSSLLSSGPALFWFIFSYFNIVLPRSFLPLLPSTKQLLAKIARWKGHSILLDFLYSCAFQINLIDFLFSCPFPDQGGHWELVGGRQNWWSRDSCTEGKD